MNIGIIRNLIGKILILLAVLMLLPLLVAIIYQEGWRNIVAFISSSGALLLTGIPLVLFKAKSQKMGAREGLIIVGLSWVLMSLFGCLPFIISGEVTDFFTAFFEITSGFTTTGASALFDVAYLSHSMLFWRSFSHWIGGMGILVFILAVIPESREGSSLHILRAESPGPQVGKLVSRMQVTSRILYIIYLALSVIQVLILLVMFLATPEDVFNSHPDAFFNALVYTFGTAGTGGFATTSLSIAAYHPCIQYTIAIFMILFGVNFTMYYYILIRNWRDIYKNTELRWYFFIIIVSVVFILINVRNVYDTFEEVFRHSLFQVASIISTTGYTSDPLYGINWPVAPLVVLIILSVFGSCAGSTSGGVKLTRVIILTKYSGSKIKNMISPRKVDTIWLDGKPVDDNTINATIIYFIVYVIILVSCAFLISIYNPLLADYDLSNEYSVTSFFTASLACISNVGPGLGLVGPNAGYASFSWFSKMVLSFEMIAGRLELFPILVLFSPNTWKKRV